MSELELEKIMYAFISGEIDVLVATTIIETGLDISNVNTMIIDDADKMGLSQLYQLRGRVGRSARTAYAFLMYKRGQALKEIAEKRLQAIRVWEVLHGRNGSQSGCASGALSPGRRVTGLRQGIQKKGAKRAVFRNASGICGVSCVCCICHTGILC